MATVEEQMGAFKPLDVLTTDTFGSIQEPLPDMNAPEYKDMRSKFVEDVVKGSITSPITATADMVELGAAAPALSEEMQSLFPTYTVLEKGFNDLKEAGLNRETATELIKKTTGIELGGTAGEFTGELIGLPVVAATNILAKTVQAARKYGPDAINYISTVADDTRDVFRTASGGDDFDGMAPAVAGRTSQTTTPTIKTNLPDTSVSPSMIGVSTPRGQRAVKDYEDLKGYRPDISEEELFAQVGVWKGADNKYRTELSTIDAELNYEGLQKLKDNGEVELKELLDFDTLFDSYNEQYYDNLNLDFVTPQSLDKLKIKVTDNPELLGGYNKPEYGFSVSNEYDVGQEYIELKLKDVTDDGILSTLLHEVQHAIQAREGFAKGSNTRMFYPDVTEAAGFGRLNFENYQEEIARLNKSIDSPMRLFKKREEIASNLGRKVEARPAIDIPVTRRAELLNDNSKFSLDERVLIDTVIPDILLRRLSDKQSASKKLNDPLTSSLSVDDYKITKEDVVEHLEDFSNSLFFKMDYFDTKKFDAPLEKAFASTLSDKQMKTFLDSAEKLLSNENMSPTDLRFVFDNEIYNKNRLEKLEIVIPKRAELEYRRTYGELEASLIEKRLKRRKQLNAETDMTRAEIEQQMSEEFPPLGMEIKKSIAQVNPEFMEGLIVNQGRVTVPPEKSIISEVDVLASKSIDETIPVFPKPERMFPEGDRPKGGKYLNPITGDDLTGMNVPNASLKIKPDGKPSFNVTNKNVESVGTTGKGNTQIKTNLFKSKAGWKWKNSTVDTDNINTLISVTHKGKHYYTLETDFSKGVTLKNYPESKTEPKLRPTVQGQIEMGNPIGTISVRGKEHPVYDKVITFAEGGAVPMKEQMSMFEDGGLMDEGGSIDPVSGNDVPPGSTQEEVRDDIPAQLSEGEFVFPADVVRYFGLETLMKMRQEAKAGLQRMEDMGQMGNSDEAIMSDTLPFDINDLDMEDDGEYNDTQEFAVGGMPTPNTNTGVYYTPAAAQSTTGVTAPQPVQAASSQYVAPQQQAVPTTATTVTPTYESFIKPVEGSAPEIREYINTKTGEKMSITFINNQPTVEIPPDFVPASEYIAPETVASQTSRVKTTRQVSGDGDTDAEKAKEEAMYGPGGGRVGVGGNIYGVGFSGKGMGLKTPTGMVMTAVGLATGKPIPAEAIVNFQRPDNGLPNGVDKFSVTGTAYNNFKSIAKKYGYNSRQAVKAMQEMRYDAKVIQAQKAADEVREAEERVTITGSDESYDSSASGAGLESSVRGSSSPGGTGGTVTTTSTYNGENRGTTGQGRQDYTGSTQGFDARQSENNPSGDSDNNSSSSSSDYSSDSFDTAEYGAAKGGLFHKQMKRSGLASK